ncbi:FHA domain-containing protein [Proteobacteria bacterium 005FR1]|nr:FHA domain-containing protein [Proteobacteria bacterium 005FR1]
MLKLRLKNNKGSAVWLVEPKVTVGRGSGNDLMLEDLTVDPKHAEILVKHEKLTLVNTSGKTVLVNGQSVTEQQLLKVGDQLQIGETALEVIDPKQQSAKAPSAAAAENTGWALKANHTALANRIFHIKSETVIGRSNDCDITLAAAHLSRRHVKLFVEDGLLYARDLGSANGTYLNGEKITEARVRRGDELRFDTLSFGVIGPASEDLDKTSVRPMAAFTPKPQINDGAQPSRAEGSRPGTRAERPAAAAGNSSSSSARVGHAAGGWEPGRKGIWALGLLLAIALAAGIAWQQGLFGA